MLTDHTRNKLINAIIYFAKNTNYLGKTKLFKLLYFLDFEHFMETGRSVTGMDYYAWKMGPVPIELDNEMECPDPDIADMINFKLVKTKFNNPMLLTEAKSDFDSSHFSKRELRLLKKLSEQYKNKKSDEMIEATHLENLPWHQVYYVENKKFEKIPYEYALRKQEKELMNHIISQNQEITNNYK